MKYLKIFEDFSNNDWKKQMLDLIEDMVYNIKDVAAEYLDEGKKVIDEFEGEETVEKTLLFNVMIGDDEGSLYNVLSGHFNNGSESNFRENFIWSDDLTIPFSELKQKLDSGEMKFHVDLATVIGFGGDMELTEDSGHVHNAISEMYPDVQFDIINPWDLN
jgi:hypothetical protein